MSSNARRIGDATCAIARFAGSRSASAWCQAATSRRRSRQRDMPPHRPTRLPRSSATHSRKGYAQGERAGEDAAATRTEAMLRASGDDRGRGRCFASTSCTAPSGRPCGSSSPLPNASCSANSTLDRTLAARHGTRRARSPWREWIGDDSPEPRRLRRPSARKPRGRVRRRGVADTVVTRGGCLVNPTSASWTFRPTRSSASWRARCFRTTTTQQEDGPSACSWPSVLSNAVLSRPLLRPHSTTPS